MKLKIVLNGTSVNPYHRWGMAQNPFPQHPRAELNAAMMQVNSLDGDPITGPDDIRRRLAGWDPEFVEGVIERFQPGKRIGFVVEFPYP
jgi:hypothetical protein